MQIVDSAVENFYGCNILLKFTGKLLQLCCSCNTLLTSFMEILLKNFLGIGSYV